jgi:hypothetical protein
MKTAEIGTIIQGTLLVGDLIEAFTDELKRLDYDNEHEELIRECEAFENLHDSDADLDKADDLIADLTDALQDAAPDFCYFGAHEGDGSDFGFWICDDSLRESIHDGTVVMRDDGQRFAKDMPEYLYHVSNHGNPTLYKITLTLVW